MTKLYNFFKLLLKQISTLNLYAVHWKGLSVVMDQYKHYWENKTILWMIIYNNEQYIFYCLFLCNSRLTHWQVIINKLGLTTRSISCHDNMRHTHYLKYVNKCHVSFRVKNTWRFWNLPRLENKDWAIPAQIWQQ